MTKVFIINRIHKSTTDGHSALGMSRRWILMLVGIFTISTMQQTFAQATGIALKALAIGDNIPDALWNAPLQVVNHPQGKQTITLADYKGKLILLDFWSTWCSPCIRNFPKVHALQDEFGDKIKVLAATPQSTDIITKFFNTGGKAYTYVNSVINDSILSEYFPHNSVPHVVWISTDGKLLNTTQSEEITQANIQAILDKQKMQMVSKIDIDLERPLFLSEHFSNDLQLKSYSIFSKGYYPGLPSGGRIRKTKNGKVYGRQMTNLPLMEIYYPILYELFNRNGEQFNLTHAIITVKDQRLLNGIYKADSSFEGHNLYNYELIVPEEKSDSLYYYMLSDLNRYSDYTGTIEKRMVDCLILVRTSTIDKLKSKGGAPNCTFPSSPSILTNQKLSVMINMLADDTPIKLPIIDETDYTGNVDIEIPGVQDLSTLQRELNRYDLELIPAKRSLNMFVLKDK